MIKIYAAKSRAPPAAIFAKFRIYGRWNRRVLHEDTNDFPRCGRGILGGKSGFTNATVGMRIQVESVVSAVHAYESASIM